MEIKSINGYQFSTGETAVAYVKARWPRAHMLRDCVNGNTIHVWATYTDFADNHKADAMLHIMRQV